MAARGDSQSPPVGRSHGRRHDAAPESSRRRMGLWRAEGTGLGIGAPARRDDPVSPHRRVAAAGETIRPPTVRRTSVFSVATWNLENLFRPGGDAGPDTAEAYDAKLSALQDVIERLVPDVLAVQEVGQPEALEDLRARVGADWESALSALPDGRGIRVGFLSRLPMDEVEHVNAFPAQLAAVQQDDRHVIAQTTGRGLLRVRVHADGEPVDLVTCHLKSMLLRGRGSVGSNCPG